MSLLFSLHDALPISISGVLSSVNIEFDISCCRCFNAILTVCCGENYFEAGYGIGRDIRRVSVIELNSLLRVICEVIDDLASNRTGRIVDAVTTKAREGDFFREKLTLTRLYDAQFVYRD